MSTGAIGSLSFRDAQYASFVLLGPGSAAQRIEGEVTISGGIHIGSVSANVDAIYVQSGTVSVDNLYAGSNSWISNFGDLGSNVTGSLSINNTPFTITNIQSGTAHATSGASVDISNLARKTVHVSALTDGSGTGTGSQLFVEIQFSHNGAFTGEQDTIDSKRYESGTATQTDTFSYSAHLPFVRTVMIGSNVANMNVSTVITGRGV